MSRERGRPRELVHFSSSAPAPAAATAAARCTSRRVAFAVRCPPRCHRLIVYVGYLVDTVPCTEQGEGSTSLHYLCGFDGLGVFSQQLQGRPEKYSGIKHTQCSDVDRETATTAAGRDLVVPSPDSIVQWHRLNKQQSQSRPAAVKWSLLTMTTFFTPTK